MAVQIAFESLYFRHAGCTFGSLLSNATAAGRNLAYHLSLCRVWTAVGARELSSCHRAKLLLLPATVTSSRRSQWPSVSHVRCYSRATSNTMKRRKPMSRIKQGKIRVLDENDANLGIMESNIALPLAESKDCKLHPVFSGSKEELPVYKIMSGKAAYESEKRMKEQAKLTKKLSVKEIQITTVISDHDFATKLKHAREMLQRGHNLQLCLVPRRDRLTRVRVDFPAAQRELLERFLGEVQGLGKRGGAQEYVTGRGVKKVQILVDRSGSSSIINNNSSASINNSSASINNHNNSSSSASSISGDGDGDDDGDGDGNGGGDGDGDGTGTGDGGGDGGQSGESRVPIPGATETSTTASTTATASSPAD